MQEITKAQARAIPWDVVELKVDGIRATWDGTALKSDRGGDYTDRFGHIVDELRGLGSAVRGEIALPGGNVLDVNKKANWHQARFYIFDMTDEYYGNLCASPLPNRCAIEVELLRQNFRHLQTPQRFESFSAGWRHVTTASGYCEGLVLKSSAGQFKIKQLREEKLPIIDHIAGKSKGAFLIDRGGVTSRVSAGSVEFVRQYHALQQSDRAPHAEIEFPFLTDAGKPFQPRLRRVGTLAQLS